MHDDFKAWIHLRYFVIPSTVFCHPGRSESGEPGPRSRGEEGAERVTGTLKNVSDPVSRTG